MASPFGFWRLASTVTTDEPALKNNVVKTEDMHDIQVDIKSHL